MSRSLMLSLALLAGLAVVGSALGSGAHPRLAVKPGHAAPGAAIRIVGNAGSCAGPVTAISKAFPGHAYGEGALTGRVGANGRFVIHGRLRRNARPARYAVSARCGGGNLGVTAHVRVS